MENQTNAEQNAASEVVNQVDVSQGYPVGVETPKTPEQISPSQETPKEEVKVDDKVISERLKQQNARQAKLLQSLGIDPLSDIGEQLENGLITPEMVKQHLLGKQNAQVAQEQRAVSNDPIVIAQSEYDKAKLAYDTESASGSISIPTNTNYLNAIQKLNEVKQDSIRREMAAEKLNKQVNENVERVLSVARAVPEYVQMNDTVKKSVDTVTIAMTGIIADREARKLGLNPAALSPSQYEYFANKASEELGDIAEFYVELGRQQVRNNLNPQKINNNKIPVPISGSGSTPVPAANKYGSVNISNHLDAAREFARRSGTT